MRTPDYLSDCIDISGWTGTVLRGRLHNFKLVRFILSLQTADVFPVASLPPKSDICEPEQQNDFRDVKPFLGNHGLALKIS